MRIRKSIALLALLTAVGASVTLYWVKGGNPSSYRLTFSPTEASYIETVTTDIGPPLLGPDGYPVNRVEIIRCIIDPDTMRLYKQEWNVFTETKPNIPGKGEVPVNTSIKRTYHYEYET